MDDHEHSDDLWIHADKVTDIARICFGCGTMFGVLVVTIIPIILSMVSRWFRYMGW